MSIYTYIHKVHAHIIYVYYICMSECVYICICICLCIHVCIGLFPTSLCVNVYVFVDTEDILYFNLLQGL